MKIKNEKLFNTVLAPPLFIILHIVEEFVFPDGFMQWYKSYKPAIASSG